MPKLHLKNIQLASQNDYKKSNWIFNLQKADFQGFVKDEIIKLNGNMSGNLDSLTQKGRTLLANKPVELETDILINPSEKLTEIENGKLNFAFTHFDLNGSIKTQYPEGNIIDLNLHAENEFDGLFGFLPDHIQSKFKQVNEAAKSKIDIQISGLSGAKHNAGIEAKMVVSDVEIISLENNAKFEDLNFQVTYTNGEEKNATSSELIIKDLKGTLEGNPINVDLNLTNFENPNIESDFDFNLDLKDLTHFIPISGIKKSGGKLALEGKIRGEPNSEKGWTTSLNGYINFEKNEILFEKSDFNFTELTGKIEIQDSLLFFKNLKGNFSDIPFNLTGNIKNSYRLFLNNRKDLDFELNIYSNSVNLNNVFKGISKTGKKVNKGDHALNIPKFYDGIIQLNTPQLKYRDAVAQRFSSTILIKNGGINIPKFQTDVLHGHLSLDAKLKKISRQNFSLNSNINLGNINAKRLFKIFKNFDQKVLTSKQIEGRLNAQIQLNAMVDSDLKLHSDGISYFADFSVKKAELIDFEPITKALRHVVKKKEAAHVLIDNLKGKALFHKHEMFIPFLNFESNLTTLSLHGNRKPNDFMDFNVQLSLANLLFNFKKRKKSKKSTKEGRMNVRVNLTGKPGEMKIRPRNKKNFEEAKRATNRAYTKMKRSVF